MTSLRARRGPILVLVSALCVVALGFVFKPAAGRAEGYIPTDDQTVLAQVPSQADPAERELNGLRGRLTVDPKNLELACEVARRSIQAARARSDPRYLGRAQAALEPWWAEREPPPEVILLRATIRQSQHDFDSALEDLDVLVRMRPNDAQAWLTRATVLTVLGRYPEARLSCAPLARLASALVTTVCTASIDSLTGDAPGAYRRVQTARVGETGAEGAWALSIQGEIAIRMGDDAAATRDLSEALSADPSDAYTRTLLSDLYLDLGRNEQARDLVADHTNDDAELLRLVLAETRLAAPAASGHAATLRDRYEASRARGDVVHRREQARFYLFVDHRTAVALELAVANWSVQREPADARILLECALAAGDSRAAAPVVQFVRASHIEEPRLVALAARAGQ